MEGGLGGRKRRGRKKRDKRTQRVIRSGQSGFPVLPSIGYDETVQNFGETAGTSISCRCPRPRRGELTTFAMNRSLPRLTPNKGIWALRM